MFKTDNQQELVEQFAVMMQDHRDQSVAEYAIAMAVDLLNLVSKRQQKLFIKQIATLNGSQDCPTRPPISAAARTGPTPLIAAMRCFVASKLGVEVDIPEELL